MWQTAVSPYISFPERVDEWLGGSAAGGVAMVLLVKP